MDLSRAHARQISAVKPLRLRAYREQARKSHEKHTMYTQSSFDYICVVYTNVWLLEYISILTTSITRQRFRDTATR